ncbi:4,5-DOPA dioxygenase extradiol-like [Coffea eugenioides]|uniref:4,5-DOPA dioxygenase extradiol-like n=1 Tax=Coffea eugenioides TaxID=49369 RepID=UPI000F608DF6|nr:4,5-DOPA dioxygenase extradiol-like [Coffea eugenioides]
MGAIKETFFILHGPPMISLDDSFPARHFLLAFKERVFSQRPKGILIISAHWETSKPAVNLIPGRQDTIHDFISNFPRALYQIQYPAPSAPELAKKVKELLTASGFDQVEEDKKRGLDHGAWVPLMLMYLDADIPVCQLSVQPSRDGTYHYRMGRALAPLKDEGYLIVGSGAATHNTSLPESTSIDPCVLQFDTWLKEAILTGRYEDINQYEEKAPYAKEAHPWPEHFYPLHVAMGAAGEKWKAELIHHSWSSLTSLSYASYKFVATD